MEYLIDRETDCWNWLKSKNRVGGYGVFHRNGKKHYAHRYYYEAVFGEIPKGMSACHKCDNPGCVNPDHIFIGTHKENMMDAAAKKRIGRNKRPRLVGEKTCLKGHSLIEKDKRGWFFCRICKRTNDRLSKSKRKK